MIWRNLFTFVSVKSVELLLLQNRCVRGKDSQAVGRARAGGGKGGVRSLWVVTGGGGG